MKQPCQKEMNHSSGWSKEGGLVGEQRQWCVEVKDRLYDVLKTLNFRWSELVNV